MRIAQRTVSRNYKASLNRVMAKRADTLRRSEDGFRFKELSEDVAAGARAMNTQEMRYAAIQQQNTAEELIKELDAAWGVMGSMDQTIQDVLEEMKSAAGVRTEEKLAAIQKKIHNLKEEYLQELNTQYSGKYLFGGTNNKEAPFSVDENDRLLFNGVEVSKIYLGEKMMTPGTGLVGDPAADALYANDSRYYNDGVNYYHNDGKYYYDAEKKPPEFSMETPGYAFDLSRNDADLDVTDQVDVYVSAKIGDAPLQYWDNTNNTWTTYQYHQWLLPNDMGPLTNIGSNDILQDLLDDPNGVKIGDNVYKVSVSGGNPSFTWLGRAETDATAPADLDTTPAAEKAASAPKGEFSFQFTEDADAVITSTGSSRTELKVETTPNTKVPYSDAIYLDTGLGLTIDRDGGTSVDSRTAFHVNVVGLELCGFTGFVKGLRLDNGAYDQQTISNNIYDMISEVERLLAPGYSEKQLDSMQMQLTSMNDTMRMARTDVDTRSNSLENMVVRLKTEIDGMEKLEDSLMTADPAGEAIDLKDIEYSWQAVLALGSQILPSSLLDYLK